MVYFMENPIKMDDLGGFPPIFGNTQYQPPGKASIYFKPFNNNGKVEVFFWFKMDFFSGWFSKGDDFFFRVNQFFSLILFFFRVE